MHCLIDMGKWSIVYWYSWIELNTPIKGFRYDFFLPLRRDIPDMQHPSYTFPVVAVALVPVAPLLKWIDFNPNMDKFIIKYGMTLRIQLHG